MSENLKLDIDKASNRPIDTNVINVLINIKDNENAIDSSQKVQPNFFKGRDVMRVKMSHLFTYVFRSQNLSTSSISFLTC